jgi:hypothetical protein
MYPGNRRRGQDVASLSIINVKDAAELNRSVDKGDIYAGLTPRQKEIAEDFYLITVLGKCNLHNHCLLSKTMKAALDLIVRDRETVGNIMEINPFVFAIPQKEDSFLRHSPILKDLADSLGVENMATKNMRKYLATTFQVS